MGRIPESEAPTENVEGQPTAVGTHLHIGYSRDALGKAGLGRPCQVQEDHLVVALVVDGQELPVPVAAGVRVLPGNGNLEASGGTDSEAGCRLVVVALDGPAAQSRPAVRAQACAG